MVKNNMSLSILSLSEVPQMGPLPWVFLFFSVLSLCFKVLVILYFISSNNNIVKKDQIITSFYYWLW
uniref:ATP synthase subunit 8 n=1 Tax=Armadillidium vulgare TaxID=13347 RepID=B0F0Z6_ARMVU|nr:ATP synthase subunit 8 [Armadillidium vulgare]